MIWSRERQGSLAERIVDALRNDDRVVFEEDPLSTRRYLVRLFAECDKADDQLRRDAETSVARLKRNVPAGSGEWEVLVRKEMGSAYDRLERFRIRVAPL